jgi:hypothetical protein
MRQFLYLYISSPNTEWICLKMEAEPAREMCVSNMPHTMCSVQQNVSLMNQPLHKPLENRVITFLRHCLSELLYVKSKVGSCLGPPYFRDPAT